MKINQNLYARSLLSVQILFLAFGCKATLAQEKQTNTQKPFTVTIDPAKTFQTIDHFGASDAWSCQFIGKWPDAKRNVMADLLFSRDTLASGQPKGIGLSLWRFNIGAGTAEQGDASGIKDAWRRAEGFLSDDGSYNWEKQAGQLWFLTAAKQRGVNEFLAFPNSPPVQLTTNKKGFANNGKTNLTTSNFQAYANYISDVIVGVKNKTGILFDYISPMNEPQWDWSDGGQEGTPFYNNEIASVTRYLSGALLKNNLTTQINVAEAGQIDYLYSAFNKTGRGDQITAFFNKNSPDYIGQLPNLYKAISGHSYFTTSPYKEAVKKRQQLAVALKSSPDLKYWMSEYCILGDNDGEIKGEGRNLGIDPALYVGKLIHNDLVNANASGWHWWIAISPYDYKDGLIYVDKNKTDGSFTASKMLWALGNFSQFIRPGAVRVEAESGADQTGLLVSSYLNENNQLVTVIVNENNQPSEISLTLKGHRFSKTRFFRTSDKEDLAPVTGLTINKQLPVKEKSILTVVSELN